MNFQIIAKQELDHIFDLIDDLDQYEADLLSGILNIDTDFGQYVINIHYAMEEIWVSSPISGGHHFKYHAPNEWISKNNINLRVLLSQELAVKL